MGKPSGGVLILSAAVTLAGFGGGYAFANLAAPEAGKEPGAAPREIVQPKKAAKDKPGKTDKAGTAIADTAKPAGAGKAEAPAEYDSALKVLPDFERTVLLGRVTVPIERPSHVSYLVTDLGMLMPDADSAAELRKPDKNIILRDTILRVLQSAATSTLLRDTPVDTDALIQRLRSTLEPKVGQIDDVLLLSFYVADLPRS
jgi:flagellar basal body-associated protein FliL